MLTDPTIVERGPLPYVAIRETVQIPFGSTVDRIVPEMVEWLQRRGVTDPGPPMFKYNVIRMPELEMEIGFTPPGHRPGKGQ